MNLIREFQRTQRKLYGSSPALSDKQAVRFEELELELMKSGIGVNDYTRVISRMWCNWVKTMELQHVPANVFLGAVSKVMYKEYLVTPTVRIPLDYEMKWAYATQREYNYACNYVSHKLDGNAGSEKIFRIRTIELCNVHETEMNTAWLQLLPEYKYEFVKLTIPRILLPIGAIRCECFTYDNVVSVFRNRIIK